jgi:hypothetical protein
MFFFKKKLPNSLGFDYFDSCLLNLRDLVGTRRVDIGEFLTLRLQTFTNFNFIEEWIYISSLLKCYKYSYDVIMQFSVLEAVPTMIHFMYNKLEHEYLKNDSNEKSPRTCFSWNLF